MTVSGPPDDYTDQLKQAAHGLFSGHPMTTELPRIDSEGLRMAAEEGHQRVSSVASINKGEWTAEEVESLIHALRRAEALSGDAIFGAVADALTEARKEFQAAQGTADDLYQRLTEARSEIERLTELANKRWRETKAMQAALGPFASAAEGLSSTSGDEIILSVRGWAIARLKPSELRAARAALSQKDDGGKECGGWRKIDDAPDGGKVLVIGGRYEEAEIVESDGPYWRANIGRLKAIPTYWMPRPTYPHSQQLASRR